jgi:His-Xaa-Ser system radical SAM maturase HxsB
VLLTNPAGEFLFLSPSDFEALIHGELATGRGIALDLESRHFIAGPSADAAVDLLATQLRTRKGFLRDFASLHMVVVTGCCNFRCDYCQASSAPPEFEGLNMSRDTARAVVDMVFQTPSPAVKIEFQGGEPLLNWPVVQHVVEYAEKVNRRCRKHLEFVLCTNLTLLESKMLAFLRHHGVMISTSLDGPRDLHNLHRISRDGSSGYDLWRDKLALVQENAVIGCSALLTITGDHLGQLREVIDEYVNCGFDGVFLRAVNPYGRARAAWEQFSYSVEEFVEAYQDALDYILCLNQKGRRFTEYYTALLLARILTPFSTGFVDLQSPSGAGIGGVIYDFDGNVFPADEGRMLARMGDNTFRLGNVHTDSYEDIFAGDKLRQLTAASCLETLPGCAWCAYQPYCGGDPIRNYVESRDIVGHRPTSDFCKKNRAIFNHLFGLIRENDSEVMDVFWSWITNRTLDSVRL